MSEIFFDGTLLEQIHQDLPKYDTCYTLAYNPTKLENMSLSEAFGMCNYKKLFLQENVNKKSYIRLFYCAV